jgi:Protein of unknown function, DUF547
MNPVKLSQDLLFSVKTRKQDDERIHLLSAIPLQLLCDSLNDLNSRKCFWINCYNAFVQVLLGKDQVSLNDRIERVKFFGSKRITISNHGLSLNDIEHGMLRNSSIWWSMGYLKKILVNDFERRLRVPLDYRIHFALNCGAKSCPAIAFYSAENLDEQLNAVMQSFLEEDVKFDEKSNTVILSPIFSWFRGDFGSKKGIIQLLRDHHLVSADSNVKIKFREYDWSIAVSRFTMDALS